MEKNELHVESQQDDNGCKQPMHKKPKNLIFLL